MILNQKALNRAINERMSTLTDDEVFLSEAYKHRLTQMSTGVLQAARGNTVTIAGDPGVTAYTDGTTRTINYMFDLVQKQPDREAKDKFMRGFNLHETAHCLLTDFALHKRFMEKLMKEQKFLCEPYQNPYKEMTEKGIQKANVAMIFHNLDNSLEDGFINRAVQTAAPGYYEDLLYVLNQFAAIEQFSYANEANKPKALLFSNMTLLYAVYGLKAYAGGDVLGNPLLMLFEEVIPWIDKAVVAADPEKRKRLVATVFCYLFRAITMDWEEKKKKQEGQQGQQGQQGSQGNSGNDSGNSGNNSSENKDENNSGEKNGKSGNGNSKSSAEKSEGENSEGKGQCSTDGAEGSNEQSKGSGDGNDASRPNDGSNGQENAQNGSQSAGNGSSEKNGQSGNSSGGLEIPDDPSEQSPNGNAGCSSNPVANESHSEKETAEPSAEELQKLAEELEKEMHSSESADHSKAEGKADKEAIEALKKAQEDPSARNDEAPAQEDMEKLAKELAEKELREKQEEELKKQLQADTAAISKESMHRGIKCHVVRPERDTWSDALYEQEKGSLDTVVKRMSREFLKEIKERQTGDTMTGLYNGKSLDVNHLYRDDKRIFSQKILPEDIPDMAVGILVDCSGSMSGNCRMDYARRCAYVTYEFCKTLKIPCFVFGHTTRGDSVVLYSVADENSLDRDECKRIFCLHAGGSNRDGYALRYCLNKLEKINAKDRLMMIISDGQPAHRGYGLNEGKIDLQDAVHGAIKKDIHTVAAGIDCDADRVRYVYKDGRSDKDSAAFLEITDLDKLPKTFVKIIKKRLS